MKATRRLHLCADDFGLSAAISNGISRLADAGRLSAVSCITTAAHWPQAASALRHWPNSIEVGLHFNLTEGAPLSTELARVWPVFPTLPKLLVMSHLRHVPRQALRSEWQAQIDAFTSATGRSPRMVDGHQHVHHLPVIRDIVLAGVEALPLAPAVRCTGRLLGPGFGFKRFVIERSGGRALRAELRRRGLRHNAGLLGAYDFIDTDYRSRMQGWLSILPPKGGLLFCHPGELPGRDEIDVIAAARVRELGYLGSEAFAADLAAAQVVLGPAWRAEPVDFNGRSTRG